MKGDNHLLAVTTTTDEVTGEVKPLFAFPVQVCKATQKMADEAKLSIAAPSGAERQQVYMDAATGEIVADADCPRGIRVGDEFRPIPAEAITAAKGQKTNMMVAEGKVPLTSIDFTRTEDNYFVQSPVKGGSAKAYRLLYEALAPQVTAKGKIEREALALVLKRTPRTNEKLCVIYADTDLKCLRLVQMRFACEQRQPDEQVLAPMLAEVTVEQIATAAKVLDMLPDGDAVLATAVDDNVATIKALMEKAVEGEAITAPTPVAATVEQDDLAGMLEASLAAA